MERNLLDYSAQNWKVAGMEKTMGDKLLYITIVTADVESLLSPKTTIAVAKMARSEGYEKLWEADEISWPSKEEDTYERTYCFRKPWGGRTVA